MTPTAPPIRWGIISTGGIAATFARDLQLVPEARLVAVGSRSQASADAFGDRFAIPRRYASYQDLVEDSEVDAVYVATPHPGHHDATRLALRAGKAALCEKPFTMTAAEADSLIATAREHNAFLMEAMWTRFLPHVGRIRELLRAGVLGDLRTLTVDHAQWFEYDPAHRLFAPDLGGGALLDLGIYPVSFASFVFGAPDQVTAVSDPTATGVDAQTSVILQYAGGRHAVLTTTLGAQGTNRAAIVGTDARIEIDATWYQPTSFALHRRRGGIPERFEQPRIGHGLRYQAIEVGRCLREGLTESPLMPLAETHAIMSTMDEIRRQIGLEYPVTGVRPGL
jgi:predicted dehydrogenase